MFTSNETCGNVNVKFNSIPQDKSHRWDLCQFNQINPLK